MTTSPNKGRGATVTEPVRVMVVVGEVGRRAEIAGWIDREPDLAVIAAYRAAGRAAADIDRVRPDLVVVDPETAAADFGELAELAVMRPGLPILMVRADGSPGQAVSRFGIWETRGQPGVTPGRKDLGTTLIAAIRGLDLATSGPAIARPPIHRHPVAGLA